MTTYTHETLVEKMESLDSGDQFLVDATNLGALFPGGTLTLAQSVAENYRCTVQYNGATNSYVFRRL